MRFAFYYLSARPPAYIHGQVEEVVESYKYLGTIIDNKLSFEANIDTVCAKA